MRKPYENRVARVVAISVKKMKKLGFSEMREFCEFYLSLDILLLAGLARYDSIVEKIHNFYHFCIDIMTNFRSLSLLEDKLDPLYYLTLPG